MGCRAGLRAPVDATTAPRHSRFATPFGGEKWLRKNVPTEIYRVASHRQAAAAAQGDVWRWAAFPGSRLGQLLASFAAPSSSVNLGTPSGHPALAVSCQLSWYGRAAPTRLSRRVCPQPAAASESRIHQTGGTRPGPVRMWPGLLRSQWCLNRRTRAVPVGGPFRMTSTVWVIGCVPPLPEASMVA
jgi:hypothetical protein